MSVAVIHPQVLIEPVVEYEILRYYILLVIYCTHIAQCEWPVVSGALEGLPEAARISTG
jgi:hypothetical protein